ncbi:hypothetical protein EG329_009414 [Mollisiaceae sp. DMI_Dod_QoI]|nr:hypothetical protein EG329_009414 [Helotiales sp. DMI_Dod_QoI]
MDVKRNPGVGGVGEIKSNEIGYQQFLQFLETLQALLRGSEGCLFSVVVVTAGADRPSGLNWGESVEIPQASLEIRRNRRFREPDSPVSDQSDISEGQRMARQ